MSKLFFEILATVKGVVPKQTLTPPNFIVSKADVESVEIEIIRRDSRGEILRWEVAGDESFQQDVVGLTEKSGTLLDSGTVVLTNNGTPIGNFYLRVRDTNRPTYNDGIQAIQFIRINEIEFLPEPQFTVTPLVDSALVVLSPVNGASRYILDISTDGESWTNRDTDYDIGDQPYEVTGLEEETVYFFRVTATSDSLFFRDSFAIRETETLPVPTLPSPTDITLEDLGSGTIRIGTVYSGVSGVTYVVQRDEIEVYSGLSNTFDLSGFVDGVSYILRVKVQKSGYDDSDWYSETYTHQDVPTDYLTIEQFGGNGYYKRIDEKLDYTSLGNGTTRITYTGVDNVFDSEDVGKRFCGLYAHKNPITPNPSNVNEYYPNIEGSRYCTVLSVTNGKNIIVDFEFNLNKTNWTGYIFFDNSKAFSDMIDSLFSGDLEEVRLVAGSTYVVPEFTKKILPTTKPIKIWTGSEETSNIKLGYEDYYQWGLPNSIRLVKQSGIVFGLTVSDHNFISHNINWIPPHRRVPEAYPVSISFFGDANVGLQNRIVAIINNNAFLEQEEIGELNERGNFATNALGFVYSGGSYSGDEELEDTTGYIYVFIKDFKHQGNTLVNLKANSGGGIFYVCENVVSDNRNERGFNPWYFEGTVKLTDDKSGFSPSILSRSYYPSHVLELTSDNSWFQSANATTNSGWGNAGNVIQIGGFVFWQPVASFWNSIYEQWYSRGNQKKTWIYSDSGSESFTSKKMMIHKIPRSGQRYTVGRSYTANDKNLTYKNSRFRGIVNWSAALNKRWDLIDSVTEIPANSFPLEFQPGDRFTIVGHGSTIYTVIRTDRIEYPNWESEIWSWGVGNVAPAYYAPEYYLDKELPSGVGFTFEIDVIESKAEVLFDGVERPMYSAYKANLYLRSRDVFLPGNVIKDHDINTDMSDGNIIDSDPFGHTSYNHEEITMWAKNYEHLGDYRQSYNAYPTPYTVVNPATGQSIVVGPLRKYSKGYTLINSSGFERQFNPVSQFEIRDLIRKSQGINLPENEKEKLRMYNCADMNGLESQSGPYLENYPDDSGAPDMPTACRDLLNSLP